MIGYRLNRKHIPRLIQHILVRSDIDSKQALSTPVPQHWSSSSWRSRLLGHQHRAAAKLLVQALLAVPAAMADKPPVAAKTAVVPATTAAPPTAAPFNAAIPSSSDPLQRNIEI
jgi:hypothetical protein